MACRRRIRTLDLRVMGPVSCQAALSCCIVGSPRYLYTNKMGDRSRQPNAFGFTIHYNILETEKQEKTEKL